MLQISDAYLKTWNQNIRLEQPPLKRGATSSKQSVEHIYRIFDSDWQVEGEGESDSTGDLQVHIS